MKEFFQAGIFHCSEFRDQDIDDRAKADPFAKAFAILQSTWFLCNIIARWASNLPVSPIELSTVAYVVCGVLVYAAHWHKPKNMSTSIKIYLRYTRATLPAEIHRLTESHPTGWVHLRARVKDEGWLSERSLADQAAQNYLKAGTVGAYTVQFYTFVATLFCAIHIAAWKFDFPSYAERIACTGSSMVVYARFLDSHNRLPSFMRGFTCPASILFRISTIIALVSFYLYVIARLGMTGLVFSSLRALPVGSYTTTE
ncbi:hypothetical protein N7449_000154 [Penicillium cf. viridicatum]|uniref:Uncharacterized protein n=1 Tax=Penicillium cf. viridicatum TaxID=2972119 RepID=A0A9W9N4H9_9EURO|nr:hypothetical protein N7449_000154 [Penicillium cf. viridicatum]